MLIIYYPFTFSLQAPSNPMVWALSTIWEVYEIQYPIHILFYEILLLQILHCSTTIPALLLNNVYAIRHLCLHCLAANFATEVFLFSFELLYRHLYQDPIAG